MKKIKLILFSLLMIFIFPVLSFARTCTYTDQYSGNGIQNTVVLELTAENNGQTSCEARITLNNSKTMNNKEDCQNWIGEVRNTYYLNDECPYYVFMTNAPGVPFSASVKVTYNYNSAQQWKQENSNGYILRNDEYDPDKIHENLKENCNDYTSHEECYYGVTDKEGNACLWNPTTKICERRYKCSDYTSESTCPEKNSYGRCRWNSTNNKCEKYDIFFCEDYISEDTCPKVDEEGNNCKWISGQGCVQIKVSGGEEDPNDPSGGQEYPDYQVDPSTNINNICSKSEFRKPARLIGIVVTFLKILVPIFIVLFGAVDFYKAITSQKDDGVKKAAKSIAIRAVAGIAIFLLPGLVQMVLNMVNEWSEYKNNWCCCTECILNSNCDVNSCSSESCHIEGTN